MPIDLIEQPDPLGDETWCGCENLIRAFEQAWRQPGSPPAIDDYLRPEVPRRAEFLLELVHVDLEFRIKSGESARVEDYLVRYPALAEDEERVLGLIAAEYEFRRRQQQELGIDEYRRRFPAVESRVSERLGAMRQTSGGRRTARTVTLFPTPVVPGYDMLEEIGRGGMGIVYRARESRLGRLVALKFLPAELAGEPLLMERFVREARTASALNHPHICTVHALDQHEGRPFIVLEYIEGQTLRAVATRALDIPVAVNLIRQAAGALAAAHAAGVVHRDIKPENLMVRPDGYVKVLDFGLARQVPTLGFAPAGKQDTWPGAVLGTVAYMSPEQSRGEPLGAASDIFSLGIVLYQLVTGQHPFECGSTFDTLHAIAHKQPSPASHHSAATPAPLDKLLESMLQKDARLRPSAVEVERALACCGAAPAAMAATPPASPRRAVGREAELDVLRRAMSAAARGRGSMVCICGEPGIGKTTLVQEFLQELDRGTHLVARGRCSERQAASAYLPIMDALADLLRSDAGSRMMRLMDSVAPTWALYLTPRDAQEAELSARALSQQAMLREFANLLAEAAQQGTMILFVDDVHWADTSTVDLLDYIGRKCEARPVLVIVTCRPTEMLLGPHPFHRVRLELQSQGLCSELSLGFLDPAGIDRYLEVAFPGHAFPADFAQLVHSRTEGSPLFMADLLRYLREREVIACLEGRWTLARSLPDLWQDMPETVRSMIQRKLQQLGDDDRRLLTVAAAQGQQFDSAVVAQAIARDPADVEDRLQQLDRVHGLVALQREEEFPDRTLTLRYTFVHVLYQQALFATLPPTRRASISRALAQAWHAHLKEQATSAAAPLACLYEAGREFLEGARQYGVAARNAARVFAHRDAVVLARRGLSLLEGVPASAERDAIELSLQTTLGLQLQVTEGYAAASAEQAYQRARSLCASAPHDLFPVLWGLWLVCKVRSELPRAQELAAELLDLATRLHDPDLALQAHQALGLTALCRGRPAEALHHVEQVATLYHPERHRQHAFLFGQDPGVICKAYGAVALCLLGFPDAAERQSDKAIEMSRGLSPTSQAVAFHFAAMVHQLGGDVRRAGECASVSAMISAEHGFPFWLAGGHIIGGWAMAAGGDPDSGVRRIRAGLDDWHATGSVTYLTYFLALLATALEEQGESGDAARVVDDALQLVQQTDERMLEAELTRLRGELRARRSEEQEQTRCLAAADFRQAIAIALQQKSPWLALKAATSLARLESSCGNNSSAGILSEVIRVLPEGHGRPEFQQARSLLEVMLSGPQAAPGEAPAEPVGPE